MILFELVTLSAASWYIAYVLTSTSGPFGIFEHAREWRGGFWHGRHKSVVIDANNKYRTTELNGLLDCIVCLMFWVAQALALVTGHTVLDGLAVAGVGLWIHRYSGWHIQF